MKHKRISFKHEFKVAIGNRRSQAAQMVLEAGEKTGDDRNRHQGSDQWLFVFSGQGLAIVDKERIKLEAGSLLLIERNEAHEIRNTSERPLKTLNIYVPPAYSA